MTRPVRLLLVAIAAVVGVALLLWLAFPGDAADDAAEGPETVMPATAPGEAPPTVDFSAELEVANVRLAGGAVSATITNTSSLSLTRAVVRFDLFSGGEKVAEASASRFGLGPGASAEVSTEVRGPVTVDSVAVRETVATPSS